MMAIRYVRDDAAIGLHTSRYVLTMLRGAVHCCRSQRRATIIKKVMTKRSHNAWSDVQSSPRKISLFEQLVVQQQLVVQ